MYQEKFNMKAKYRNVNVIMTNDSITLINHKGTFIKPLNLTYDDIKAQFMKNGFKQPYHKRDYNKYRNEVLENSQIPYFNFIYYYFFFRCLRVPTLDELLALYVHMHCDEVSEGVYQIKPRFRDTTRPDFTFRKENLIGRASRAVNSFNREMSLFFGFKEFGDFKLEYNFQSDLAGVDLTVTYNDKNFYIASLYSSDRSLQYKNDKDTIRHVEDYKDHGTINFVADKNVNCVSVNNIYVYAPWYLEEKHEELKKMAV